MHVELYYSYISESNFASLERLLPALPPGRRERIAAGRDPAGRAQSIAVTALLQNAVTEWEKGAGFGNKGVVFCAAAKLTTPFHHWEADPNGRPFPHGIDIAGGRVWVSLSHSGGHLLVAVADRPVGVDIQELAHPALAPQRFRRLDGRIRHPAECPAATPAEVAARWAAKEAATKLTGAGLTLSFRRLQVQGDRVWGPDGACGALYFWETTLFAAAVVVKAAIPTG